MADPEFATQSVSERVTNFCGGGSPVRKFVVKVGAIYSIIRYLHANSFGREICIYDNIKIGLVRFRDTRERMATRECAQR